jgi:hypothetical protein
MSLQTLNIGCMLDLQQALLAIGADIARVRAARTLPALVCPVTSPVFPVLMGQEQEMRAHSPPRIVFTPTGLESVPARTAGQMPPMGRVSQLPARPFGGRGSASTSSSGAIRIPSGRIHCSTSTRPSSSIVSYSAPCTASAAAPRTSRSAASNGDNRTTTIVSVACSSATSRSPRTSRTSPTTSSRTRILAFPARRSRSTWTSPLRSPTAPVSTPAQSYCHREAA